MALAWVRPWMLWAAALAVALLWAGVQGWRLDRCRAAGATLAAEHAALVAAANRQSAAVDDLARQAAARQAAAAKAARQAAETVARYGGQAESLKTAQEGATQAGVASCAAAVATVREGLR